MVSWGCGKHVRSHPPVRRRGCKLGDSEWGLFSMQMQLQDQRKWEIQGMMGVGVEQCSGLKMNPSGTSTQQGHLKFRSFPDWDSREARRMAERAPRGRHETWKGASRGPCNANPLIAELLRWGALGIRAKPEIIYSPLDEGLYWIWTLQELYFL